MFVADQHDAAQEPTDRLMTANDVLALRQTLKTFDGNFARLLRPSAPSMNQGNDA
jgi:hypothetical protein